MSNTINKTHHGTGNTENDFIKQYMPLVKSVANRYRSSKVQQDDLMQEGFLGLMEAKERFDPLRGVKFSTYAVYWIKNKILESLSREGKETLNAFDLNDEIDIPQKENTETGHDRIVLPDFLQAQEKMVLRMVFEEHQTLKEIADIMNLSRERVRQIRQKALRRLRPMMSDHNHDRKDLQNINTFLIHC
jgi:RNA polymerase sporulation-specific sigma factor